MGMIVVGYPLIIVREGVERPGTDKEQYLKDVSLTTPWNHMEAAFAFERELPLMVLRDRNLKVEGFMEHSVDWEVKRFDFTTEFVLSREFSSMVEQFYNEIDEYVEKCSKKSSESRSLKEKDFNVEDWTLGNLISAFSRLSLPDTMKVISIITTLLGGTFYLGHKLGDLIL